MATISNIYKKRGEMLVELGLISNEQLRHALSIQKTGKQKIEKILIELGLVTKEQITESISKKLNIPIVFCEDYKISDESKKLIPKDVAKKELILPIEKKNNTLILAMADPLDFRTIDYIAFTTKLKVSPVISYEQSIIKAIEQNYGDSADIPADKEVRFMEEKIDSDIDALYTTTKAPLIINFVETVIADALKARASDIHIEPRDKYSQIRFRIDGGLHNIRTYDKNIHDSVVSRIKIIAGLDITSRRLPQDGSTHISFRDKEVDLRISTVPTIYGEKVVVRLLDQSIGVIPLSDLAMPDSIRISVVEIFKRPQGMLIVTGPTGSGKTTTLYACLSQLRSETKNIVTIEDPVEYKLEGITQIQINEMIGRTFATVLRAVLRQDPDIIKIGEIRDLETAEIAIRASLTGHLVLTTLHTNNTVATITRLMDIGIPTYLINSAISGVLAQRLVRRLCDSCKVESKIQDDLSSIIDQYRLPKLTSHYISAGCPKCFNTGYVGRIAVYEYLPMSQPFKRLISKNVSEEELLIAAKNDGVNFLFDDAWNKVKAGITTAEEVVTKVPLDYYELGV